MRADIKILAYISWALSFSQVLAAPVAAEPEAQFACPAIDTVFTYNIISRVTLRPNEFRILGRRNFACLMHSTSYGDYEWVGGIAPYHGRNDDVSAVLAYNLWPLKIGNHAEEHNQEYRIDFDVVDFEPVQLPLGTYDAFKIAKLFWTKDYTFVSVVWWSPHFRWVIKQEEHLVRGDPRTAVINNWTLETVSLP